jgi:SAM-dependent methyltransferase
MDSRAHWENVFQTRSPLETSWYTPHLEHSLLWIREANLTRTSAIIDVGAGESTLVDDLLVGGFTDVTVLDISASALEKARRRLGEHAASARWIVGDVTEAALPEHHYDLWHDRAVFHFLVDPEHRKRYVNQAAHALKAGGRVLVSTFGPEGPSRCSGLEACRYDSASIAAEFGEQFTLEASELHMHTTPSGGRQQLLHARFVFRPKSER